VKAIILAAGRGERMRPLTDHTPKPLLEAGGKSLIEWQIGRLVDAGIVDIVVNVSHFADQIETALGDGTRYGARIRYSQEPVALETAGGIVQALPLLGRDTFVAVNGDVYCEYDYGGLARAIRSLRAAQPQWTAYLVLVDNPEHHPHGDFALRDHRVHAEASAPRLTFSGIGVYRPEFFDGIAAGERRALGPLLHAGVACGAVYGEHFRGLWMDIGTPQRLEALREHLRSNRESLRR